MTSRPLLLTAAAACVLLLGGCRGMWAGNCHKAQPYDGAETLPSLKVPAGLDGPDTGAAMRIPVLNEPEAPVDNKGLCLDAPPALTAPPLPSSGIATPRAPEPRGPRAEQQRRPSPPR